MCLILVASRVHPEFPLVVAANRDEFHARPTEPAGFWKDRPGVLAGRDLEAGGRFYEAVLATIGYSKLISRPTTIGFGKTYADFWINARPRMATPDPDGGVHVCLRAPSAARCSSRALRTACSSENRSS